MQQNQQMRCNALKQKEEMFKLWADMSRNICWFELPEVSVAEQVLLKCG
jgi:hypothetical protein